MIALEQRCHETLERSWTVGERDGVSFARTRPSPERCRWQWYSDSCFAAIAWRQFDPTRSRGELETMPAAARPGDHRNGVAQGLREFYDPRDGRGTGAQDFVWSAPALELLDPSNANAGVPA